MRRLLAALPLLGLLASAAPAAGDTGAFFTTACGFSHRAPDDPIVAPNRPGAAHMHDFFGNRSTSAASTHASLLAAETTCRRQADRAAYWVPTLFTADGQAVRPLRAQVYYRGGPHADPAAVRAFPADLRVIAGDARATGPQPLTVTSWNCSGRSGVRARRSPPLCPAGYTVRLQVRFPECWDGSRLDSQDHASHMAYARRGACPGSHPVAVPQLVLNVIYPIRDGRGATLSSGSPHTVHADFLNAWEQDELERLVAACIHRRRGDEAECRRAPRPPLDLSRGAVAYRGEVTISGRAPGGAGRPVWIQYHRDGAWETLAAVTAAGDGTFGYRFRAGTTRTYRARLADGRATDPVRLAVRPRIATFVRRQGRRVALHARSTPMKRRLVFRAERRVGGRWRTAARREVTARRGRGAAVLDLGRPGTYRVRVLSRGDRRHAAGRSHVRTFAVR